MGVTPNKKPAWFTLTDRCPYSGLPITHPESFFCSNPQSNCRANMAKIGDRILILKVYGYISSFAESELLAHIDGFITRHFPSVGGIAFIEDYADITGGDAESRKQYIRYFSGNRLILIGVLYHLSPLYFLSVNLAKKLHLYAARCHTVHTYEQAMDLVFQVLNENNSPHLGGPVSVGDEVANSVNRFSRLGGLIGFFQRYRAAWINVWSFLMERVKRKLFDQCVEKVIRYIASIDWQKPGIPEPPDIRWNYATSRKMMDAVSFVKSEIDTLLEERAATEAMLRENEARYRLLVEHAKVGILEYDFESGRILSVNDEIVRFSGYSREEVLAINPLDLLTEESREKFQDRLRRLFAGEILGQGVAYQSVNKNKEVVWWILNADIHFQNGRPHRANVVITDITPLKLAESKLLEYQEKLKSLSVRLSMVEEDQRRRMASHLHETIGQELFVMRLQLDRLEKSTRNARILSAVEPIKAQLSKTIKEIRALTFDLSPPVLYHLGLKEALETLITGIASSQAVRVNTDFGGDMDGIPDDIKAIIYRSVKELIHNTLKHAGASHIGIQLENVRDRLYVSYHDDGAGFDAAASQGLPYPDGFGLFDIREKLLHLSGQLAIESMPGEGIFVCMEVPLGNVQGN